MKKRIYTPEKITSLKPNEIFVFGSNLGGQHGGGAARFAHDQKWIEWLTGRGMDKRGKAYAFPTLTKDYKPLTESDIIYEFVQLIKTCRANQHLTFLLTKVGCGIAGLSVYQMRDSFQQAVNAEGGVIPDNLIYPREFEYNDMQLTLTFASDGTAEPKITIQGEPKEFVDLNREQQVAILRQLPKIREYYAGVFARFC